MNPQKNISKNYVNEHVVRLVATQVVIITSLILLTGWGWLSLFLAIDFMLRAFFQISSPLAIIAKGITTILKMKPKPIFAPPKQFAASMGMVFSWGILMFFLLEYTVVMLITGYILILCATLEASLNICLGCYVYNCIIAPVSNSINNKWLNVFQFAMCLKRKIINYPVFGFIIIPNNFINSIIQHTYLQRLYIEYIN